jgi:phage major head subunit gpT-like protein
MAQAPIRAAQLAALSTAFDFRYNAGITRRRTDAFWPKIADRVGSSTGLNIYPFLGDISGMKEWVGPRVVQQLSTRTMQVINRDWETTLAVPRNAIADDQYGLYANKAELLGYQAEKLPDDLVVAALQGGKTSAANTWDGVPFFSANHAVNIDNAASAVQSNLYTGTPLNPANFDAVRVAFSQYKTDAGRVTGWAPDTLFVPPQLEKTARDIVSSNIIAVNVTGSPGGAAAVTNNLAGTAQVVVIPELGNEPLVWYPAVTRMPVKPLIWQERQAPNMVALTDPTSRNVFFDKEFIWGVDARGAAAYGMWFLIARCEG